MFVGVRYFYSFSEEGNICSLPKVSSVPTQVAQIKHCLKAILVPNNTPTTKYTTTWKYSTQETEDGPL